MSRAAAACMIYRLWSAALPALPALLCTLSELHSLSAWHGIIEGPAVGFRVESGVCSPRCVAPPPSPPPPSRSVIGSCDSDEVRTNPFYSLCCIFAAAVGCRLGFTGAGLETLEGKRAATCHHPYP